MMLEYILKIYRIIPPNFPSFPSFQIINFLIQFICYASRSLISSHLRSVKKMLEVVTKFGKDSSKTIQKANL